MTAPTRRAVLKGVACAFAAAVLPRVPRIRGDAPIRRLTKGPAHHWFGYYDKLQFDPAGKRVLGMAVTFEHRTPKPDDVLQLGFVDLAADDAWVEFGTSTAWGWQQGCMLQWRPGSASEVVWNDRDGDRYVARILDVDSGAARTIDVPIYAIAPDGKHAVGLDFRRVQDMRPGYGYVGLPDPHADELAPADSGIERIDLETGEHELVVRLADVVAESGVADGAKHWFNHLLWNTDGTRFVFLHRWRAAGTEGFRTRMLTAAADGSDVRVLDPSGSTSHFIWRDPQHVLAWSRVDGVPGFWVFDVDGGAPERVGATAMIQDGHCTYLPDRAWILCDTYPDRKRLQHPYLFHVPTGRKLELAALHSPSEYRGEWRCDTHPRQSPDGRTVVVDSPHGGDGRQMWAIDVGALLDD